MRISVRMEPQTQVIGTLRPFHDPPTATTNGP